MNLTPRQISKERNGHPESLNLLKLKCLEPGLWEKILEKVKINHREQRALEALIVLCLSPDEVFEEYNRRSDNESL